MANLVVAIIKMELKYIDVKLSIVAIKKNMTKEYFLPSFSLSIILVVINMLGISPAII